MKETYLKLYGNCIPVRGHSRSVICDLQMGLYKFIPNDLFDILIRPSISIKNIKLEYGIDNEETINEYFDYILKNGFGFICNKHEVDLFPMVGLEYNNPYKLTNIIIEVNSKTDYLDENLVKQILDVNCKNVQIISFNKLSIEIIFKILNLFKSTIVKSIELILWDCSFFDDAFFEKISAHFLRVTKIILYNSSNNKLLKLDLIHVLKIKKSINNFKYCGIVNQNNLNVNIDHFSESTNFNSCLNRKISIDVNGNIKNCPSMQQSFGNIKDTTLEEALNHKDFKKYWNITKDQIDVCKDCEFRYICTDCRAYIEKPDDIYSKPLKCGYNPYTNEWSEWSTNPLKEKAIEFYGMQELVKKDNEV